MRISVRCRFALLALLGVMVTSPAMAGNPFHPSDFNVDDQVDVGDLLTLLGEWGPCSQCPTDLDGSGDVGTADLSALLSDWGDHRWLALRQPADSIAIHVAANGNDANDGRTAMTPVRTLARAHALIRDGRPDWILVRRGDVFTSGFGTWSRSGRSAAEPIVVGTYGASAARPLVQAQLLRAYDSVAHVVFTGLAAAGTSAQDGVEWQALADDITFEDIRLSGFNKNMVFNAAWQGGTMPVRNVKIVRCILVDASPDDNSSGIYAWDADLSIYNSVFDRNGWNTGGSVHQHNLYLDGPRSRYRIVRSLLARGGSDSIKLHAAGSSTAHEVSGCLFFGNPIAAGIGGRADSDPVGGITMSFRNNTVLEAADFGDGTGRGYGLVMSNIADGVVEGNVFAFNDVSLAPAILARSNLWGSEQAPIINLTIIGNEIAQWPGGMNVQSGVVIIDNTLNAPTPPGLSPSMNLDPFRARGKGTGFVVDGGRYATAAPNESMWVRFD